MSPSSKSESPQWQAATLTPANPGGRMVLGICVLLAAMVWAVFGGTRGFDFIGADDPRYVSNNAHVAAGLSLRGIRWAFTHTQVGHWAPLTTISHMADCQAYGPQPGGHHLTNVLLHGTAAILLFLVLRGMTGAFWRSAFVAAVFAVHPLRVESVAWVSERKDVLSGVFFMLTLAAYTHYTRRPGPARLLGTLAVFAAGLMAKSMLVTLPFVLLLLDYWPLGRFGEGARNFPRLALEKAAFFALSAAACVVQMRSDTEFIVPGERLSLLERIANAPVSCAIYLRQMIWPARLSPIFYPHPANHLPLWEVALAVAVLGAISVAAFGLRRSRPYLLAGWLWYLGMLVPVIGLVQSGWQAHADRYTYLPQIGLYIAIAWTAGDLCAGRFYPRVIAGASGAVLVAVLMACARAQTAYWKNDEALWTRMLALAPEDAVAQNGYGAMLVKKGRVDEGAAHYLRALEINPTSSEANYNLGVLLEKRGQVEAAVAHYRQALESDPDSAECRNNLAAIVLKQAVSDNGPPSREKLDMAIGWLTRAVEINPDYADARNNLGFAFQLEGRADESIAQYQAALEISPELVETRLNLGIALAQKGNANEALAEFAKAVEIDPGSAKAHNDLGLALLQGGHIDEAIAHFHKALEIEPGYAEARSNLALALQQKGK